MAALVNLPKLGLGTWFHPSIAIIRQSEKDWLEGDTVIQPGDLLWTDFGITYLRMPSGSAAVRIDGKPAPGRSTPGESFLAFGETWIK